MENEIEQYIDSLLKAEENRRMAKFVDRLAGIGFFTRPITGIFDEYFEGENFDVESLREDLFGEPNASRAALKRANASADLNMTSPHGNECAGTYYVNGYTKEDGTEVNGYMRTCGAAHNGNHMALNHQFAPSVNNGDGSNIVPLSNTKIQQPKLIKEEVNNKDQGKDQNKDKVKTEAEVKKEEAAVEPQKSIPLEEPSLMDNLKLKEGVKFPSGKNWLFNINNSKNRNFKEARDCMNIALIGPKKLRSTDEYLVIKDPTTVTNMLGENKHADKYTVVFKHNSSMNNAVKNSPEFRAEVENWRNSEERPNSFIVSFNKDPNLFRSLHNVTVFNPQIKDGYFTCYVYDYYDFKGQKFTNKEIQKVNDGAVALQTTKTLENYHILIPIKIKL